MQGASRKVLRCLGILSSLSPICGVACAGVRLPLIRCENVMANAALGLPPGVMIACLDSRIQPRKDWDMRKRWKLNS